VAYVIGGYDGSSWLNTIVAWSPTGGQRVAGRLPFGLRYAAVAPVGPRLIIAGGTETGSLSDQILSFDTRSGAVARIGTLPYPLTHASAATLDGQVVIVGGRRQLDGDQTAAVLAVDPATGRVRTITQLPHPLSDAAVVPAAGRIVVAGGDGGSGAESSLLALVPTA